MFKKLHTNFLTALLGTPGPFTKKISGLMTLDIRRKEIIMKHASDIVYLFMETDLTFMTVVCT